MIRKIISFIVGAVGVFLLIEMKDIMAVQGMLSAGLAAVVAVQCFMLSYLIFTEE